MGVLGGYTYANTRFGGNEDDETFDRMLKMNQDDGPQTPPAYMEASGNGGMDMASMGANAATGAAMGGPVGAGIAVGGSMLTNYLANKAATERQKRANAVQIENEYTKNMGDALTQQLAAYRGALR